MARGAMTGKTNSKSASGVGMQITGFKRVDDEKLARSVDGIAPKELDAKRASNAFWEYAALQGEEDSILWRRAFNLTLIAPTYPAVERAEQSYRSLYIAGDIERMPVMPSKPQHSQWTNAVSTAIRLGVIPAEGLANIDMSKGAVKSWAVPEALAACSLRRAYDVDGWLRKLADVLVEPNVEAVTTLYKRIGSAKGSDLDRLNANMRQRLVGDVTDNVRAEMLESVNALFTDEGWTRLALPPSNDELARRRATAINEASKIRRDHEALAKELDNHRAGIQRAVDRKETPTDEQRKVVEELSAKVEKLEAQHDTVVKDFIAAEGKRNEAPKLVAPRVSNGGKRDGYTDISVLNATAKRFRESFDLFNDEAKDAGLPPRTETEFLNVLLDSFAQSRGEVPAEWSKAYANYVTIREQAKAATA